ncbi:unnamed protein product [Enterobius vermicularis]|uniref:AAA_11 domain-containing protein n=1 Tax=Enterobius vermicularis TaxID=51028 RepID=A0A0N4VPR5_ENTVE|nr:unnamed protein product [Enterobius vermicularis]
METQGKLEIESTTQGYEVDFELDPNQQRVMEELRKGNTMVFAQAPAGTGKTYVVAAYVSELYRKIRALQDRELIVITAPTNLAVQNVIKRICQFEPTIPVGEMLLLQSAVAEKLYPGEPSEEWQRYKLANTLKFYQKEEIPEALCSLATRYIEQRAKRDGRKYKEGRVLMLALKIKKPTIVLGTEPMITNFLMQ